MPAEQLWRFLPIGYAQTVAIEGLVLLVGLAPRHPLRTRLLAALWLTACTYPIVVLVLPLAMLPGAERWQYLAVAESFAPAAECLLFYLAFDRGAADRRALGRDMLAIVLANVASFALGELWR